MRFWTTIALIAVLSALGLTYEIAAGRVLAPFFGTSLLTWTTVIAVVLAGFALGSAWGGFLAERPRPVAVRGACGALVATAILMAASPLVLSLVYAMGARGTGGMVTAVVVAFLPASVLVTMPSPLLAKLAVKARPGREGSSLGLVLAAGSLGAIAGAVLAGFVALPLIGSTATFAGCGALALLCLLVLRGADPAPADRLAVWPAALVVASSLLLGPTCRWESGLSCLDVDRRGDVVHLYSDRIRQAGERTGPDPAPGRLVLPYTRWIWARMERDLDPAPTVLFVGGGGYSLPARLLEADPGAQAVAVEIDPLVTRVAHEMLPWAGDWIAREGYDAAGDDAAEGGRLGIVHADGRVYLNETDHRFDAAVMDAFSSGSVPAHLVTRETFARLRKIVDGPVYVNLLDRPDGHLARGVHAILADLWSHVEAVSGPPAPSGLANVLLVAAPGPLDPLDALPTGYAPITPAPARAFTDDRGWIGHR
jgi:predicted membrane-bound spermidine synthase